MIYAKEWAASIIDTFEDFLDERGISIPNMDKQDYDAANIYGEDFDELMDKYVALISRLCEKVGADVDADSWG